MNIRSNPSLKAFHNTAEEFLTKLMDLLPHEKKICTFYTYYTFQKKMHIRKPVEIFIDLLYEYGIQIMSRDEAFFKSKENVKNVETFSQRTGLVEYWDSMDKGFQDMLWEYIQNLYILGMLCVNKHTDLEKVIQIAQNKSERSES